MLDEEQDEILRDMRNRQAEVRAERERFGDDQQYWAMQRAELEAQGVKFVDEPPADRRRTPVADNV